MTKVWGGIIVLLLTSVAWAQPVGIFQTSQRGTVEDVRASFHPRIPIDIYSNRGMTPLMYAVRDGSPEVVRFLVESGADPFLTQIPQGRTLYAFVDQNRRSREMLETLIDLGVVIRIGNAFVMAQPPTTLPVASASPIRTRLFTALDVQGSWTQRQSAEAEQGQVFVPAVSLYLQALPGRPVSSLSVRALFSRYNPDGGFTRMGEALERLIGPGDFPLEPGDRVRAYLEGTMGPTGLVAAPPRVQVQLYYQADGGEWVPFHTTDINP